ncbi:hypothetical protein BCU90_11105 [Vibrio lentus]|uniref:hypothetical protein n=1 Tax=Vibrio TaxID=662 RepID=UPI000C859AD9|nr:MULTISPECIES: hypothetical protein [Vibrio]PMG47596.1 hypothetical protein BCU90_11105 [Vibrio lentus]PMI73603.1 hypothetical protein BCU38_17360 [Vibrio splendidus]
MGYNLDSWVTRFAERSDLSTRLVHLTKPRGCLSEMDVLFEILESGEIKGSGALGYINGDIKAACFQDAPLDAICQNCWFEQKYRDLNPKAKVRYKPIGLLVDKEHVYSRGGRPVIYDKVDDAKEYLSPEHYWRIVDLNLEDTSNIVDWTHEREWRVPHSYKIDLSLTILLFTNEGDSRKFIERCEKDGRKWHLEVAGFVTLSTLLY